VLTPGEPTLRADPERLLSAADRLSGLSDEVAELAARLRTLPLPGTARRDALLDTLSRQVVRLALAAHRTREHARRLDEQDRHAAAQLHRAALRTPVWAQRCNSPDQHSQGGR
jgi:hypothetical protein